MAYQEPIAQPIVAPEPEPVPVAPREMSEYERLVSANTKDFAPETHVIEEEKSDFDYFALKGTEEVDPHNNSLQFANSEFVNKQIEEIESKELEDSKGIGELLATYKKKIIIGVAAVVFVICAAILYISFTSSSDTPSIPVPTDQSSGTSGEKPVILVPSQNGGTQQSGYDQNGNVVGQ